MKNYTSVCVLVVLSWIASAQNASAEELIKCRIGWQVPWAVQGHLVQIWKHTDILRKNGLECKFIGKTYGPELNQIAVAGDHLDVILTADQPAAALFSKNGKHEYGEWIGIARMMYNRVTLGIHPDNTSIKTVADLRGKTVAVPIGAAAERGLNERLHEAGLEPGKTVRIVNLGVREQVPLMKMGAWGNFDALAAFDPIPAIFEAEGKLRMLAVTKIVSMVLMNKNLIEKHPSAPTRVAQALLDAYDYYRKPENLPEVNEWFIKEARLRGVTDRALLLASSIEPNVTASSCESIRVTFSENDYAIMQKGADFLRSKVGPVDMRSFVTNEYAQKARCE